MTALCCPICANSDWEVLDSRPGSGYIRRRRQCKNGHRFTTKETFVDLPVDEPEEAPEPTVADLLPALANIEAMLARVVTNTTRPPRVPKPPKPYKPSWPKPDLRITQAELDAMSEGSSRP